MKIKTAEFIQSINNYNNLPINTINEYVFIGRSNTGKSSLINALISKKIAKVSSTPGKTQLINYYLINNSWFLLDFPGYGYAKTSKINQKKIKQLIINYLLHRKQIINIFILIDSRHFALNIDLNFIKFIGNNSLPFSLIFTKNDKINNILFEKILFNYKKTILKIFNKLPPIFITSSKTKFGCNTILQYIDNINQLINKKIL